MHATDLVSDDGRDEARLACDHGLQHRQARCRLNNVVVGRPPGVQAVIAIAGEMAVHQAWVGGGQRLVIQAKAIRSRGAHRMQQHIGFCDQPLQNGAAFRAFEIDHNAALAAVAGQKKRAHFWRAARADGTRQVTLRWLQLDHVGTHVAQVLARHGSENHGGDLEDADAF